MDQTLTRVLRAANPPRALWQSVPLDFALSAAAIVLAAGLTFLGVMP